MVAGHSFNRGTGQSTILANLAVCLAMNDKQVCLVDACYSSPTIHFFYGLNPDEIKYTLNDYLWGKCDIGETVASSLGLPYLEAIAASASAGQIVLRQPDNPVTKQFNQLADHVAKHWEPLE